TVERPLQLSFQVTPERIELLKAHKAFAIDTNPKKKPTYSPEQQSAIFEALNKLSEDAKAYSNRDEFIGLLKSAFSNQKVLFDAKLQKLLLGVFSEQDDKAEVILDSKDNPEADSSLRDSENIPLGQDVQEYFEREVLPYVPNAWINTKVTDHKDGELGKIGYEIPFTRFFYEYKAPRDLKEIEDDIQQTEEELVKLLRDLTI
ncbi:SAM-dependent DNA methyltransferase, partial [Candidatus Saccharibacteria bacterium]|nr:SAM-dependent DNA methyltransferase [Candidatus Saccharibacteria bacterium]